MGEPQRNRDREIAEAPGDGSRVWRRRRRDGVLVDVAQIAARGFDDFRQLNLNPFGAPASEGIRIPQPPPAVGIVAPYRVLLASADLDPGDAVIGIRQGVQIGAAVPPAGGGGPPFYPELRDVVTFDWSFVDGSTQWTVTREPLPGPQQVAGPLDQDTFRQSDGSCALVYATAHFPMVPTAPGYLGLDGYTPPAMRGHPVLSTDVIRWPYDEDQADHEYRLDVDKPTRVRFYCDVRQTNPAQGGRNAVDLIAGLTAQQASVLAAALVPEESFVQLFTAARYWRVYGRIIIERRIRP